MNLSQRSHEDEIMDDLQISGPVIAQTLRELNTINRWLGGNAISTSAFKKLLKEQKVRSVADLGCGGGDLLMEMAKISARQKQQAVFTGIDANPHIVGYAEEHCKDWANIHFETLNIFDTEFQEKQFDVIHCCLFLHHFSNEQLVGLFRQFKKQARVAIIVNDLQRHVLAYHAIKSITRWFSKSYMVRNDAALSVARGFTRQELRDIMTEAGISNYSLQWKWAFRWKLVVELSQN